MCFEFVFPPTQDLCVLQKIRGFTMNNIRLELTKNRAFVKDHLTIFHEYWIFVEALAKD